MPVKKAVYLGANEAETLDADLALTFATREAAEAYGMYLKRPYDWVLMSRPK
jgi:hypothetical protein